MSAGPLRLHDRNWTLAIAIVGLALGVPMAAFGLVVQARNVRTEGVHEIATMVGLCLAAVGSICFWKARPLQLDEQRRALTRSGRVIFDFANAASVALWRPTLDDSTATVLVVDNREQQGVQLGEQLIGRQQEAAKMVSAATVAPIPHVVRLGSAIRLAKGRELAERIAEQFGIPLVHLRGPQFVDE